MTNGSIHKNGSELDGSLSSFSSSECIVWLTVYVTESVAIVTLNFLTIIVFIRNRSLLKLSMYLVINLAVADMLVGGFTEVMALVYMGDWECRVWRAKGIYSEIRVDIMWGMRMLFPGVSLTNLVVISLERMHATFRPFKHRVIKKWVVRVVITVTWVAVAGQLAVVVSLLRRRNSVLNVVYSNIPICLFIIFVSYSSILVKVCCGAHPQYHGASNRERKLTKTLFIVTLLSLITWLPDMARKFIAINTDIFSSLPAVSRRRLRYSLLVLLYANSLINPIVYTIRMPEFRRALVSLLIRRQHRKVQVQIPLRAISS